jgi:probable HAF family extracellular repeat protein
MSASTGYRFACVAVLLCAVLVGIAGRTDARTAAPDAYSVKEIGVVKGHAISIVYAINADGAIAGFSQNPAAFDNRAVTTYRNGKLRDLGADGEWSWGWGIGDDGRVVGTVRAAGATPQDAGPMRPTVWTKGEPEELPTLGGDMTQAFAINGKGIVVGTSTAEPGPNALSRACRWRDGEIRDLGTLGGHSVANAINDRGWIVGGSGRDSEGPGASSVGPGARAVLWRGSDMIELGTLPGGDISQARGINEDGQIVGYSTTGPDQGFNTAGMHGFLWEDGTFTDLGTLPGGETSLAFAINEEGQVVGFAQNPDAGGDPQRATAAVLWHDGEIFDLNDLIPADSDWYLTSAFGINDAGQIAGTGYLNGEQRGFVLTPV